MKKSILVVLVLISVGAGYYFTVYYPLKPEATGNGVIANNENIALRPPEVHTQYNESKFITLKLGEFGFRISDKHLHGNVIYSGVVEGKGVLSFIGSDYCFDIYVDIGYTFYVDLFPLQVVSIEDDYVTLYDIDDSLPYMWDK